MSIRRLTQTIKFVKPTSHHPLEPIWNMHEPNEHAIGTSGSYKAISDDGLSLPRILKTS